MLELLVSDEFKACLDVCGPELRSQVLDKVQRLRVDPGHPSLQAHRIRGAEGKWECYVNLGWRIIYDWDRAGVLRLWKLGDKRIIQRVRCSVFAPQTGFGRLEIFDEAGEAEEEAAAGAEGNVIEFPFGRERDEPGNNPFAYFPAAHLRILGVPRDLVKPVQKARRLEDLEHIPGLPGQSLEWLLDLATDCELEHVIFNPDHLLFKTTLDRLRGYCQGSLKRLMLNLDPEQSRYVASKHTGELVLRGCAGSGKTTVGMYRAIEQAAKGRRVLLLTFTNTLNAVNRTLIEELVGALPDNLEVKTFYNWLTEYLRREHGWEFNVAVDEKERKEILKEAFRRGMEERSSGESGLNPDFCDSEIKQVIKGNGITDLEQYLQVRRFGRNTPLPPGHRRAVWAVFEAYRELLREAGKCDWEDLPLEGLRHLEAAPLEDPYDDVILDEGQDLNPVQLRLTRTLIRGGDPRSRRTYMVLADASQTIYSRGFSWKEAGIEARGRTSILRKNFRNTHQVAAAAAGLIEHNELLKKEREFIEPSWTHRQGPRPRVVACDLPEREPVFVCERLLDLTGEGLFRLSDFAVLCPTNTVCRQYRDELQRRGIPCAVHRDQAFNILEEKVKIMTIHSAKGIEFPVVFVAGVRHGHFPRFLDRVGLDREENQLDREYYRTLLYVAMTRAAECLFLVTTAGRESPFLREIGGLVDREDYRGRGS